jgi:hypothetical protein
LTRRWIQVAHGKTVRVLLDGDRNAIATAVKPKRLGIFGDVVS